jgi:hypothetical protein|tara:strand:+ start:2331 stop:2603 length:273 start_codon:yes stop_codon:yes gene_type:complete
MSKYPRETVEEIVEHIVSTAEEIELGRYEVGHLIIVLNLILCSHYDLDVTEFCLTLLKAHSEAEKSILAKDLQKIDVEEVLSKFMKGGKK